MRFSSKYIPALVAFCMASTALSTAAHAYRSAHDTPLLGMHLKNPSGRPAIYQTSRPQALSRSAAPLYPQRFDASARIQTPEVADVASPPLKSAPVKTAEPQARLATATSPTITASPAPSKTSNVNHSGVIQLASNHAVPMDEASALAIPVSKMQLPPPPVTDKLPQLTKTPQTAVTPLQARALPAVRSLPATPAAAAPITAVGKDLIEPGISYAPDPQVKSAPAAPNAIPAPAAIRPVAAAPTTALSPEVKEALNRFPSRLDTPSTQPAKLGISRVSPDIQKLETPRKIDAAYEAAGIKIEVRRSGLDTNHELVRAYDQMMAGNNSEAAAIYRNILSTEPDQQEALFGLAALLHRSGANDKARPLYARLLKLNPQHREGLNNFISLAAEEAPESALLELERLRLRNPDFSPIHAQMGMLYAKLGQFEQARSALLSAIQLAPENPVYTYNLAVILDKNGQRADAAALYAALLKSTSGALPVSREAIQRRYNYLTESLAQQGSQFPG